MRKSSISSLGFLAALGLLAFAGCARPVHAADPAPASAPDAARSAGVAATARQPFRDPSRPLETRVANLMSLLTLDEKLSLMGGTGFTTQPIDRLGIPPMSMCDAGQGVRGGTEAMQGPATLFPCGTAMASTWDPALIQQVGQAIGDELKNKGEGAQVLLGTDINIQRVPLSGRYGECFTEDPYLNGRLVAAYIQGVQSNGVAACAKHFACNNEESDRDTVDVHVGERALREIYLAGFKAAVQQGHAWTVMPSYNLVNGYHATDSKYLLTDVARGDWNFDGLMISDWGAVHDTAQAANAGNNLEMPNGDNFSVAKLQAAIKAGQITPAQIDTLVAPIARTIIRVGLADGTGVPQTPNHAEVNSPAHQQLALQASEEGAVLLKNQGSVLPLLPGKIHSVAIIGPAAANIQGGAAGSPAVVPFFQSEPLDALRARLTAAGIAVNYAPGVTLPNFQPDTVGQQYLTDASGRAGVTMQYFSGKEFAGDPAASGTVGSIDASQAFAAAAPAGFDDTTQHAVRYVATLTPPQTGTYKLEFVTDYRPAQVYLDGSKALDTIATPPTWSGENATRATLVLTGGRKYKLRVDVPGGGGAPFRLAWITPPIVDIPAAVAAAKKSDAVVVFASTYGTEIEGLDRPDWEMPGSQDSLIQAVAAANKKTVVVLNNGGPVMMTKWLGQVPGLIEARFPGEQAGAALAAVLTGDVDPSGKLPDTLAARREDYPDYGNYPGSGPSHVENYVEGIYVGYRHFDKAGVRPLFPFGYGLSYTSFKLSNLKLSSASLAPSGTLTASVDVTNTGKTAGAEVAELYVADKKPLEDRPLRELKGFQRITLQPGQTKTVTMPLTPYDLAYFDEQTHQWTADAGEYSVEAGTSSREISQTKSVTLLSKYTARP